MTKADQGLCQLTVLPAQAERLAEVTAETGSAVAVSQWGSVLSVKTGDKNYPDFAMDARGRNVYPQNQEPLS